jgi:hypothetical protein
VSTSGITSTLLTQILESPSTANQFAGDLNQLAQDLQAGNLSAAQQDYVTLSEDALNGATSSTADTSASGITTSLLSTIAASASDSSSFASELNQLGSDLQNGDLTSAQQDMLALDSTALNDASAAGSASSSNPSTTTSASPSPNDTSALIHAIMQGMETGDNSAVSSALSQLAAISPSSAGASALQQASESFGSSASAASSNNSITQLLQSLGATASAQSGSLLNVST